MFKRLMIAAALCASATSAGAQASKYYIHDGDSQRGFIVQSGNILSTYSLNYVGGYAMYPLRFSGGNFLTLNRSGSNAVEFDATGTATGTTFANGQNLDQLLDGATDGTNTYAARCCGGNGIYQGDMQFGNLVQISQLGSSGVTYAISNGSVYAVDFSGFLYQMTTAGVLLNTYATGVGNAAALAYEQSTNTLWFAQNGSGSLYQYDLTGNQLQTVSVAGLRGYNYWAGEMDATAVVATPEPATLALLAPGLAGIAFFRRRRRNAPKYFKAE